MANINTLRDELKKITETIETIKRNADGDLSEEDSASVTTLLERAFQIKPEIEAAEATDKKIAEVAELFNRTGTVGNVAPAKAGKLSLGEYVNGYITAEQHNAVDSFKRSTAGFYFNRTVADQYLADNAAVVPQEIVGELLNLTNTERPVFSSFTSTPMPDKGKDFLLPRITQHVAVDEQNAEGDELASRKMLFATQTVTKRTFGGTLNFSQQNVDWTDPAILDVALHDFADEYLRVTEQEAIDYLQTHTSKTSAYTGTNPQTIAQSLVTAARKVRNDTKRAADTVWVDDVTLATWSYTYNTDQSKSVADVVKDALGNYGVNLKVVPYYDDAATPATGIWVGTSSLVRSFEQRKNFLAINKPSTLEYEVAYYGYIAFATGGGGTSSGAIYKLV